MTVGEQGYRTQPTIWQPIRRISELKKSRQPHGNTQCQLSWDKGKCSTAFACPAYFQTSFLSDVYVRDSIWGTRCSWVLGFLHPETMERV